MSFQSMQLISQSLLQESVASVVLVIVVATLSLQIVGVMSFDVVPVVCCNASMVALASTDIRSDIASASSCRLVKRAELLAFMTSMAIDLATSRSQDTARSLSSTPHIGFVFTDSQWIGRRVVFSTKTELTSLPSFLQFLFSVFDPPWLLLLATSLWYFEIKAS